MQPQLLRHGIFLPLTFQHTWGHPSMPARFDAQEHRDKTPFKNPLPWSKHLHFRGKACWSVPFLCGDPMSKHHLHDERTNSWLDPWSCTCHTYRGGAVYHGFGCDQSSSTPPAKTCPARPDVGISAHSAPTKWHSIPLQIDSHSSKHLPLSVQTCDGHQTQRQNDKGMEAVAIVHSNKHVLWHMRVLRAATNPLLPLLNLLQLWLNQLCNPVQGLPLAHAPLAISRNELCDCLGNLCK